MVLDDNKRNEPIVVEPLQFQISKYYDIHTKQNNQKKFQFTFDKRKIDWTNMNEYEINTLPYGYNKEVVECC